MEFIDIPTEQTTAFTDVILALVSITACIYIYRIGRGEWKAKLWEWLFFLLTVAAVLGAIVHGTKLSERIESIFWSLINLSLGLMIAVFVIAVINDLKGMIFSRKLLPIILTFGFGFWMTTLYYPDNFLVFTIYEAVAMLFSLCGYVWLAYKDRLDGAVWMSAGILISIVAALVQASKMTSFQLIWEFDHNGTYHLIQIVGILFLLTGLRKSLKYRLVSS
jgi:hypothetical protein